MRRVALLLVLLLLPAAPVAAGPGEPLAIAVLSGRADLVTGGDALLEVVLPVGVSAAGLDVRVDGRDVSAAFRAGADGRVTGLVEGLRLGPNQVIARLPDGRGARLTLTDHPVSGPLISGPHERPFTCRTAGAGLGPPRDASCSAPSTAQFLYRSAEDEAFLPYDPAAPPAEGDVATTTTSDGRTVPYVFRLETLVLNRSLTRIAVLWDPAAPDTDAALARGWNRNLLVRFGGGCGPGYHQGANGPDTTYGANDFATGLQDVPLREGYAVVTSSLLKNGDNCNDVLAAETLMVVKEHVTERYGEPGFTVGSGASGGAILQHLIAGAYPGLLDGLMVGASFPDMWSTLAGAVDCGLLQHYFDEVSPQLWALERQRAAVTGHQSYAVCAGWDLVFASLIRPTRPQEPPLAPGVERPAQLQGTSCHAAVPQEVIYDPVTNPGGARCTVQDHMVNVFGRDPATGFARRAYGNVGVQYGLEALANGLILPEQFVDLNSRIGGYDSDARIVPQRIDADLEAVRVAHATGRVTHGAALAGIPIIDYRYVEPDPGLVHDRFRTDALRARLLAANGHAENHVSFLGGQQSLATLAVDALHAMAEWLQAPDRARPADLADRCYLEAGLRADRAVCDTISPPHGDPRTAAGGPLAGDVLRCQLAPLDRAAYPAAFTEAQWARLAEAFPSGVCDWAQPGVGQDAPPVPWLTFEAGPGGRPLGSPPASQIVGD